MSRYFIVASKIFFSCKVKEPVVRLRGVDIKLYSNFEYKNSIKFNIRDKFIKMYFDLRYYDIQFVR